MVTPWRYQAECLGGFRDEGYGKIESAENLRKWIYPHVFIADVQDYNESQARLPSTAHYGVHKLDDNTVYVVLCRCCDDELISFPSSHSASSWVSFGLLVYLHHGIISALTLTGLASYLQSRFT